MKCRGVKKTRELVARYCIFEEKRRERRLRKQRPLFVCRKNLKRKHERMIKSGNSDRCCGKVKLSKMRVRDCSREF